jgi:DNA polymerase bacteriophage-type
MNLLTRDIVADTSVIHKVHWDIESRSELRLDKVGVHKYARHPSTKVLCVSYAIDDQPVETWLLGDPVPPAFVQVAQNSNWLLCSHNAQFEIALLRHILRPHHGWPRIPLARFRCTMVMGLALALPGKLESAAEALELLNQKDKAGQRLMLMMAKPRRPRKDEDPDKGPCWFDDEDRLQRLYEYCQRDVEVEREYYSQLQPLIPQELKSWQLDCIVNARGFHFDRTLALAARKIGQALGPEINAELAQITGGAVTSIHQVAKLKDWLAAQGCTTKSLNKAATEELLESGELPAQCGVH